MANCCNYAMKVVGKSEESLRRFLDILRYKDDELYLYRVQEAQSDLPYHDETFSTDLWVMHVSGNVAWSCSHWLEDSPGQYGKSDRGASYSTIPEVCRKLGVGVEIWADEREMAFQQHILVDHEGRVKEKSNVDWFVEYDIDGNTLSEEGGFEEYGEWSFDSEIW